jgi:hypothetical protein
MLIIIIAFLVHNSLPNLCKSEGAEREPIFLCMIMMCRGSVGERQKESRLRVAEDAALESSLLL